MNNMNFLKNIKLGRLAIAQIIFIVAGVLLAVGGFFFVRGLVTCWTITSLPGMAPANCGTVTAGLNGPTLDAGSTAMPDATTLPPPITAPESDLPPAWDGASRINVLLIGLDYRDWLAGEGAPRSDTMIVLTIDPLTKTAGMMSIPRDMWVNIPGFGYSRINTAWTLGRGSKLPGGGPALTMKTVSHFIGVPVDYYVQVDFDTFVDIIDLIGGVDVYNEETILLDPMEHGEDFQKVKITCC